MNSMECVVWDAEQASKYLGIHISTFYRYIQAGKIKKGIRYPGRKRVWRKEDIEKFLDEYEEE